MRIRGIYTEFWKNLHFYDKASVIVWLNLLVVLTATLVVLL